jgi:7,8-dihydropterin-6-yl-methyl-4-(beta-D-ribofuranosyl)aminobenzene 5'-phosphate synthase
MVEQLNVTAVVENTAGTFEAAGEWGLALWIEADRHRILCDTGRGRTIESNARLLGIDLASAEALVISHGHYDHTGGIAAVMQAGFQGKIYLHPAALGEKYQREKKPPHRRIGIPASSQEAVQNHIRDVVEVREPVEIAPGIMLTGSIPRRNRFEDVPDAWLFTDENCTQPDLLLDDQALLIETVRGWAVITGCAHAGLINTLEYAAELAKTDRILAVIGGLHLFRASGDRVAATLERLQDFGVELIAPCHCTGFAATGCLQQRFADRVVALQAGVTVTVCPVKQA